MATGFDLDETELQLQDYLALVRRRRLLIAGVVVLAVLAALGASALQSTVYRATAKVLLSPSVSESVLEQSTQQNPAYIEQRVRTEMEVMRSRLVRDAVAERLGSEPVVSIAAQGDTEVVGISANEASAAEAQREANTYAQTYVDVRREQTSEDLLTAAEEIQDEIDRIDGPASELSAEIEGLQPQIAGATDPVALGLLTAERDRLQSEVDALRAGTAARRATLQEQLDRLQLAATLNERQGARVVSEAELPTDPISPKPLRNAGIALVLGLVLGIGAALVREHLDDSIKVKDDLDLATGGLPVLGLIPAVEGWRDRESALLETIAEPHAPASEAYRGLRASLEFLGLDQARRIVHITSSSAVEGKTTTATNLAVVLAHAGRQVILVDCDLRRPRVHDFFGMKNEIGFTSVVFEDHDLASALQSRPDIPRLSVLAAGPTSPRPSELLGSRSARDTLYKLAELCDYLIVDSPPLLPVADSVILAQYADATILVASAKVTTRRAVRRALELLAQADAPLEGAVLNGVGDEGPYGYGYGPYGERGRDRRR